MNIIRKLGVNYIWGVANFTLGVTAGGIYVAVRTDYGWAGSIILGERRMGRKRNASERASGKRLVSRQGRCCRAIPRTRGQWASAAAAGYVRPFAGPSSIGLEMTCSGRLLLVGAFDGLEAAPDAIFNALQEYGRGYWSNYHTTGAVVSDYQREVRGPSDPGEIRPDPKGQWFDDIDAILRDAGHQARKAVHSVTVDLHWFPDDDAPWAGRIINSRVLQKRAELIRHKRPVPVEMTVCGELASDSDWAMLNLLRFGGEVLARGTNMRRAA
jgi:hypothetical protein